MRDVIYTAVKDTCQELGLPESDFTVEHPSDLSHGDYACNVAMVTYQHVVQLLEAHVPGGEKPGLEWASTEHGLIKSPRALAEIIGEKLEGQIEYVNRIEVAGPGFINFHLARDFFTAETARINTAGAGWGNSDLYAGQKIIVEYTDPNPFKEFHIGHLFTNSVGESISRLLENAGADVKRACYQGDVGVHVANAIWGMQKLGLTPESDFTARELGKAYATGATAYKEDESAQAEIKALNKHIYKRSNESVNALYDKGRKVSLAYFETIYKKIGTQFDEYFFESEAAPLGKELIEQHPEVFSLSDGAWVFKGEEHGLHTRVFLNSEGLPTYEAKELALAKMKDDRFGGYDHSIVSTANEITEYFKVLLCVMGFIYPKLAKKTEHIGHGTVRLSSGKMSSRTGDVIAALDFIQEITDAATSRIASASPELAKDQELAEAIALGAIKYATLKGNILQDSVFNKEEALSFEGASGPYLQYTHARLTSVIEKAKTAGVTMGGETPNVPYQIERILYRFEEVTEEAARIRAPHLITQYLTELAGAFNTFYTTEKIADTTDQYAPYKLAVAEAIRQTLKNGLWLLGIKAPERM